MLYLLYGPDSYRRKQRIDTMREAYRKKNPFALGETILREPVALSTLEDAITSGGGLFEEKRFLITHDFFVEHSDELFTIIEQHQLEKRSDLNLVFFEGEITDSAALAKFSKFATVEHFALLSPARLRAWISAYVEKRKLPEGPSAIAHDALVRLAGLGPDLWRLSNELEKLILAAKGRPAILLEDVLALVRFPEEETVFVLSDALCDKKPLAALAAAARLTADGGEPDGLIGYVTGEARNLMRAHAAFAEKKTDGGERFFGIHPFVWKKRVAQVRGWEGKDIDRLIEGALQLNLAWKSSGNKRLALDRFILRATRAQPLGVNSMSAIF